MWLLAFACATGTHPGGSPFVEPVSDAIYLAMVDRFEDGASNAHPVDPSDPQGWHGGDLQGVLKHLDRLQALGIHQLWLTPLNASRQIPFGKWGAYHGYWPSDWMEIEPRFGDWDDLTVLNEELEKRGMSLVLDIVTNHAEFDSPLIQSHPHWFHEPRSIENWSDPEEVVVGQVHGLPDLAQEEPEVQQFLIEAVLYWLQKSNASALRVDAVRHLPAPFLKELKKAIVEAHGNGVELIGEIFEGDPSKLAASWQATDLDRVFDFPLHYALIDTLCESAGVGRLAEILSLDRLYDDPRRLVTFLDNHDVPRLASRCEAKQAEHALRLLAGLRGTPSLTWGTEVLSEGAEEPENRVVASLSPEPGSELAILRDPLALRSKSPALRNGHSRLVHFDEESLVILRIHGRHAALVIYSTADSTQWALPDEMQSWKFSTAVGSSRILDASSLSIESGTSIVLFEPGDPIEKTAEELLSAQANPVLREVIVYSQKGSHLLGAGPEMGHWSPESGIPVENGVARFLFPAHHLISFKRYGPDFDGLWESGDNRRYWVSGALEPLEIHLDDTAM